MASKRKEVAKKIEYQEFVQRQELLSYTQSKQVIFNLFEKIINLTSNGILKKLRIFSIIVLYV